MTTVQIPSKETIEYGRRSAQRLIDLFRRWGDEQEAKGEPEKARSHRFAAWIIERDMIGEDGCVVAAFDARWLDDNFRQMMAEAFPAPKGGE